MLYVYNGQIGKKIDCVGRFDDDKEEFIEEAIEEARREFLQANGYSDDAVEFMRNNVAMIIKRPR